METRYRLERDEGEAKNGVVVREAQRELDRAFDKHEEFWRVRSRSKWMIKGDRNTKYFHHHTSQRKSKNFIDSLIDDAGIVLQEDAELRDHIVTFYNNLSIIE